MTTPQEPPEIIPGTSRPIPADPDTQPGADPSTQPGTDPDIQPGTQPGTRPDPQVEPDLA